MRRALALLAALALAACASIASTGTRQTGAVTGGITVFAASSLTESFGEIGADFQRDHPGTTVTFNFAGSSTLVTQMGAGAAADVFASADEDNMQHAMQQGLVGAVAAVFARNRLEIVVPAGNPKHITDLADLARPDVLFITTAPGVPAGKYGAEALAGAGVRVSPRSEEPDVRSVLTKVELGEADAGIVYVTDVKAAGSRVMGVPIPDADNVLANYPIAPVKQATDPKLSSAFVAYVLSPIGRRVLLKYGFLAP